MPEGCEATLPGTARGAGENLDWLPEIPFENEILRRGVYTELVEVLLRMTWWL